MFVGLAGSERKPQRRKTMAQPTAARVLDLAQEYVDAYYHQFPDEAPGTGYPDAPQDRLSDLSRPSLAAWEAREDEWLATLQPIDPVPLEGTNAWVPYAVMLERLEAAVERRSYRPELWNVSTAWSWTFGLPVVFARQQVATAADRRDALARARDVARYFDTEVSNLREGMRLGFLATRDNVDGVVAQADLLLSSPVESSPLYDPALRSDDAAFRSALREVIEGQIAPALTRYRAFLQQEYRPTDRVGVGALPCGVQGYRAAVRHHASISPPPEEIHALGLREMELIQNEMRTIARRSFGTDDLTSLLKRLRTDAEFTFRSERDVLEYTRSAVDRARAALPGWFGRIPQAEVIVRPFPAFQERTGGGLYTAAAADGSYAATYELGTHEPEKLSRASMEATAFHETWPGHHLQIALATEAEDLHPIVRYMFSSGFVEGWALYTERLSDEMGLYTSDVDRLGLLSNEAMRAARLVVDPGLHVLGWSREDAIRYLTDHTTESEAAATYEVDRYISGPGQAVSYLLGRLEISRLRRLAEDRLGARFDISDFHDRLLEDGSITLSALRQKIERWVGEAEAFA
jgi:uncharacterized protein (DUF885 family)